MNTRKTRKPRPAKPAPLGYIILTAAGLPADSTITNVPNGSIRMFPSRRAAASLAAKTQWVIGEMQGSLLEAWGAPKLAMIPFRVVPVFGKKRRPPVTRRPNTTLPPPSSHTHTILNF
ncbi:hypothetical protein [Geminisphaera colitermitum]|uniref:hypothetical protein n=1 Tax=Geminisphaera colitermitum TaxID=1148786 RepID=UPI0001964DF8|nr:hypothetical protein [Geminisphaera colitermitum]